MLHCYAQLAKVPHDFKADKIPQEELTGVLVFGFVDLPIGALADLADNVEDVYATLPPVGEAVVVRGRLVEDPASHKNLSLEHSTYPDSICHSFKVTTFFFLYTLLHQNFDNC